LLVTARVLITDRAWPDCQIEREVLSAFGAEIIEAPATDERTLADLASDVDAIGTCWAAVTRAVIEAAPKLRIVSRFGIGLDNISLEAASERRIPVTNVPNYCVSEVSDHAMALLLAMARNVAFFHHRTKQGEYKLQAGPALRRLKGQVLGLIGLGNIGREMVPKARALGLDVIAHTRSGNDYETGCLMMTLDNLLQRSDFVSLHVPLTGETQGLLGAEAFSQMKPTAFVINTSRGGLIDHESLRQALKANAIAGAGLDVFDPEPPELSHPLFQDERVVTTPHTAFLSEESVVDLRRCAARQIADALQGVRPENVVNPAIYDKS
jgi:D-3-phosphoglycerate dehydrogenase / 2-oxoglutarate reductase